jgi:hypothetical protein
MEVNIIKIPDFIEGTLEVRTTDDYLLDPSSYTYKDRHLVYLPCQEHRTCGCCLGCRRRKSSKPITMAFQMLKSYCEMGS